MRSERHIERERDVVCLSLVLYYCVTTRPSHAGIICRAASRRAGCGGGGGGVREETTRARYAVGYACTANGRDEWSAADCRGTLGFVAARAFDNGDGGGGGGVTGTRARSSGVTGRPRARHPRRPADDDPVSALARYGLSSGTRFGWSTRRRVVARTPPPVPHQRDC